MLSLDDLRVLGVVVDDMLALGPDCALLADSVADVVEEPATLGLRTGGRSAADDVDDVEGATDCRLLMVETRGAVLGATTLDGRGLGAATAGLGRAAAACDVGVGVECVREEGAGVGAGWETTPFTL